MKFPKKGTFLRVNLWHLFESTTDLRVALDGASTVFHNCPHLSLAHILSCM